MDVERTRWLTWDAMKHGGLLGALLVLASASACDSNQQIASSCRRGVCPQAITPRADFCAVTQTSVEFAVTNLPSQPKKTVGAVCLTDALPQRSEGTVDCSVYWHIPQPPEDFALEGELSIEVCEDAPFLSQSDRADGACVVHQLTTAELADGDEGWFYDDESAESQTECRWGKQRIAFTPEARPTNGARMQFACITSQTLEDGSPGASGSDADAGASELPAQCSTLPVGDGRGVGNACVPRIIDANGFDPRQSTIELGAPECSTGICLINQLDGDPSAECVETEERKCPHDQEIERAVYCTCRCNAPAGEPEGCECPSGFSCVDMFSEAPAGIRGGYCVDNRSIPQ